MNSEILEKLESISLRLDKLEKKVFKPRKKSEFTIYSNYFKELYKWKTGIDYPVWGPKHNTLMKRFVTHAGKDKAAQLIQCFFQWQNYQVIKRGFKLEDLVSRVEELNMHVFSKKEETMLAESKNFLENRKDRITIKQLEVGDGQGSIGKKHDHPEFKELQNSTKG